MPVARILSFLVVCALLTQTDVSAQDRYTADQLAQAIANRSANEGRIGNMEFILTNKSGKTRRRAAVLLHADRDDITKIAIFFTSPASIRDTAFLSYDYVDGDDQNWLFPAHNRSVYDVFRHLISPIVFGHRLNLW